MWGSKKTRLENQFVLCTSEPGRKVAPCSCAHRRHSTMIEEIWPTTKQENWFDSKMEENWSRRNLKKNGPLQMRVQHAAKQTEIAIR